MQLTITQQNAYDLARSQRIMLGDLIELREASGKTQTEIADQLGRNRSTVCRFESMESDPRLSTVFRYAHAVGAMIEIEVSPYAQWIRRNSLSPVDVGLAGTWRDAVPGSRTSADSFGLDLATWTRDGV